MISPPPPIPASPRPTSRAPSRLTYLGIFVLPALLFGLGLRVLGPDPAASTAHFRLWVVAAVLGLWLSPSPAGRRLLSRDRALVEWPVVSGVVALLLFLALGQWWPALLVLPLHGAWWTLNRLVRRRHLRRWPRQIGLLRAGPSRLPGSADLLPAEGLQYVPVGSQDEWAATRLDALLLRDEDRFSGGLQRLIAHAQATKVPLWSKTQLDEEISGKVAVELLQSEWLDQARFRSRYSVLKRVFDVGATVAALPVLLPLSAVVAVTVLINSGRPVLFWQERVGLGGQPFQIVKFRTMTRDSERSGPAFAQKADLRVTPTGAFLRKFRLDELPQFWNVLRGEMSIIGPRPEQSAFAADFEESIPLYASRHWVRPGITGWAQVNQGYTDNLGQTMEKLRYDFYYLKHLSLRLDLLIVWKTVQTILGGFGAR